MSQSLVLSGGTVYDGTGTTPYRANLLIKGEKIELISPLPIDSDGETLDVTGFALAPGFVDMHTHSDVSTLSDPACVSAIGQGVTTQIVGHCGFSAAPTSPSTRLALAAEEPVFGFPHPVGHTGPWGWDTVTEYLDAVRAARPGTNIATLVGHNTIRRMVAGPDDEEISQPSLRQMIHSVEAGIEAGAMGVSTGLSYAPGIFAGIDELVAIASAAGRKGVRYHTHMRYGEAGTRASLREALQVAMRSGCPVNISHLYPRKDDPPGEAELFIRLVEDANERGADVTFDLTLFQRGGGAWLQVLPPWARAGGLSATLATIQDPALREKLLKELSVSHRDHDWDDELIVKVNQPDNSELVGRSIGDIARERRLTPEEAALWLVQEDGQFWVAPTIKSQADLDYLVAHPLCVPVTDGMAAHPVHHASLGLMPKTFGTFPLLLGDYVRRRAVVPLAEAIKRITATPADRLGLKNRGRLVEGAYADVVVFDPARVDNSATDERPSEAPIGIRHVMVNGSWALRDARPTGARSGQVLTGTPS